MSDELPENVYDRAERLCEQWERTASLPPDARHLLRKLVRGVVLDAARLCDLRAKPEEKPEVVRSEAIKCASSVRHGLLCRAGERCCYHCDGAGCRSCGMRGVVPEGGR